MRRYVKPALRYSADTTSKIISQVLVAVVTALLVTFITNSMMRSNGAEREFAPAGMAAFGDASGSHGGTPLPPLEAVVIDEVPAPLSQTPGSVPTPAMTGGLYYAETERPTDALQLLDQAGT